MAGSMQPMAGGRNPAGSDSLFGPAAAAHACRTASGGTASLHLIPSPIHRARADQFRERTAGVAARAALAAPAQLRGLPVGPRPEPGEVPTLKDLGLAPLPASSSGPQPVGGEFACLPGLHCVLPHMCGPLLVRRCMEAACGTFRLEPEVLQGCTAWCLATFSALAEQSCSSQTTRLLPPRPPAAGETQALKQLRTFLARAGGGSAGSAGGGGAGGAVLPRAGSPGSGCAGILPLRHAASLPAAPDPGGW